MIQGYNPILQSERLHTPTVIGAITDYSPLYRLLQSNLFKFYASFHIEEFGSNRIPNSSILESLISNSSNNLNISVVGKVKYNDKDLGIKLIISPWYNDIPVEQFLFEKLYEVKRKLKMEVYNLSPLKVDMDIMYHNLLTNMNSTNFNGEHHEYFGEALKQLADNASEELERIVMDMTESRMDGYENGYCAQKDEQKRIRHANTNGRYHTNHE